MDGDWLSPIWSVANRKIHDIRGSLRHRRWREEMDAFFRGRFSTGADDRHPGRKRLCAYVHRARHHFGSMNVIGPELLEGLLFSVANWPLKGQAELIQRFKKRTGEPFLTQDGLRGYGHTWILKEALESAGAADKLKWPTQSAK